jgi:selenide,water dikinase
MNSDAKLQGTTKHIVLVGAGHAHVEVLRRFRRRPEPSIRITLITRAPETPYSGMVPGYVAGHYTRSEINIRADRLAEFEGCTALFANAVGLDADGRRVLLEGGRSVAGDLISVDVGAVTDISDAPRDNGLLVSVKPMDEFENRWPMVERRLKSEPGVQVAVVGAGAAGVELALAIRYRLQRMDAATCKQARVVLLERDDRILKGFPDAVRSRMTKILSSHGIEIQARFSGFNDDKAAGSFGILVWAAGVSPVAWLRSSALESDAQGFIAVNRHLQSISHPAFFAAGDAAGMVETPRSKAGVLAVRQGPVLAENLRRATLGLPLKAFSPQKEWLSLISAGERYAVASRGRWSAEGRWVWYWKNWLDRRFMDRFLV